MINVLEGVKSKFKSKPTMSYSLGIAATWAGAGSLIVGMSTIQNNGLIPFILWALGNTLACIVFGILAYKFEYLRRVFTSKIALYIIGIMCIFQLWINMSGIHDSLVIISPTFALIITYGLSILFLLLFLKFAMLRNVLTDSNGWKLVYVLIIVLIIVSICINGIHPIDIGFSVPALFDGLHKMLILIPGPFFFPCFWALFAYNESNKDGVEKVDMRKCFIYGGLLFGLYLLFVFILGITSFTPELEIVKGILISLVALSSLTSFIYSIYICFGNKLGFIVNTFGIVSWSLVIPLGVVSIWSLMADIRLFIVIGAIIFAICWAKYDQKKKLAAKKTDEEITE